MECYNAGVRTQGLEQLSKITGNFGLSPSGSQIYPRCGSYPRELAARQEAAVEAQHHRTKEGFQHDIQCQSFRHLSGN